MLNTKICGQPSRPIYSSAFGQGFFCNQRDKGAGAGVGGQAQFLIG